MKKTLIPVLAAMLSSLVILGGCNTTPAGSESGQSSSTASVSSQEASAPQSEDTVDSQPESAADTKSTPTRGIWEDDTYTNDYAHITFTMPDGWVYANDDEIAALMNVGAEMLRDSGLNFSDKLLELQTIYDMMAQDKSTGSNVIILFENMNMLVGGSQYTEDDYLDALKTQLTTADVYDYKFGEPMDATISGETYRCIEAEAADIGATQYYYVRRNGNYMIGMIISLFGGTEIDDITSNFS
ncbi:MAG: hypothetical protein LBV27_07910 [Oscillospiraceae bacterium]|jgi:hypothetical protein|nr:hypothetical protein [Oscillospiraceae bacterium]